MSAKELARIRQIDRQLARLRDRYPRIRERWQKANQARRELDETAKTLLEERDALSQGQLMFEYPRSKVV